MLATHWIKTGVFLLYIAILLFVISQCGRLTGTDPPSPTPVTPGPKDKEVAKATAELSVWERAQARERERKAHEAKMAKRRADYEKLEAELAAMIKNDIPAALDELAGAASAYRRKIPDLQHLKKEEQWVREAPVKEALARARQLTADYYAADREAQKGRDGPTLHSAPDGETLTERIKTLKRGGEEFGAFAKLLPPLYGKVLEKLLLDAIEAIARAALPAEAFDPCARDASACPKPPPPPAPPPPAPIVATVKSGFCVRASASPQHLAVYADPDTTAAVVTHLAPGQCGITPTGHKDAYHGPSGWSEWEEVTVGGNTGWIRAGMLASSPDATPAPTPKRFTRGPFPDDEMPRVAAGTRYCVDPARTRGDRLPLRAQPDPHARILARLAPSSCRLTATGSQATYPDRNGPALWIEIVHDEGYTGWVSAHYLRRHL